MILQSLPRVFRIAMLLAIGLPVFLAFACSQNGEDIAKNVNSGRTANAPQNANGTVSEPADKTAGDQTSLQNQASVPDENPAKTPIEAYKRLFAAVKSGKTEDIKAAVSQRTQNLAEMLAKRQNEPIAKVYANGFTRTTMTDRLPEMRDERVKGGMGAVEVWNNTDQKWEDIPFIFENGSWKLAYGDLLEKVWESPGPGRAALEAQAANLNRPNSGMRKIELPKNVNAMVNPANTAPRKNP